MKTGFHFRLSFQRPNTISSRRYIDVRQWFCSFKANSFPVVNKNNKWSSMIFNEKVIFCLKVGLPLITKTTKNIWYPRYVATLLDTMMLWKFWLDTYVTLLPIFTMYVVQAATAALTMDWWWRAPVLHGHPNYYRVNRRSTIWPISNGPKQKKKVCASVALYRLALNSFTKMKLIAASVTV